MPLFDRPRADPPLLHPPVAKGRLHPLSLGPNCAPHRPSSPTGRWAGGGRSAGPSQSVPFTKIKRKSDSSRASQTAGRPAQPWRARGSLDLHINPTPSRPNPLSCTLSAGALSDCLSVFCVSVVLCDCLYNVLLSGCRLCVCLHAMSPIDPATV